MSHPIITADTTVIVAPDPVGAGGHDVDLVIEGFGTVLLATFEGATVVIGFMPDEDALQSSIDAAIEDSGMVSSKTKVLSSAGFALAAELDGRQLVR